MRVSHFFTGTLAAISLLFASCATPQLASNHAGDDVYNTTAEAKVYKYSPPAQPAQVDQSDYIASSPNYDMDYSSRIDRFYYGNSRPYFDDYYNFYGYNSWYNPYDFSLGFHMNFGYGRWYNPYSSWAYYGSPYYSSLWGPYSYYNPYYGRYGNGYYGNNYWGNGWGNNVVVVGNTNNRPRPTRGNESFNNAGRYNGTVPSRGDVSTSGRPTRNEGYNPATNGTVNRPTTTGSQTPATTSPQRPTRQGQAPPVSRPTYTPPPATQSSPPPANTGSSRPTRGGGRG